jgi:hypothetical protein
MKRDVDFTFGFSRSRVATGTPDFEEITPNVSPARTVQNRRAAFVWVRVLVVVPAVVSACFAGCVTVVGDRPPELWRAEWIRTTAIVTATRNPAGAA